jgi:small GTP-binding protein
VKRAREYSAKIVVIGDGMAGKTCLTENYCQGKFEEIYKSTIGAAFQVKRLELNGMTITLQFWDLAGQPRFDVVREGYYRGASGCILVYDMTRRETFENLKLWLNEMYAQIPPVIPTVIVGNKFDLGIERKVGTIEAKLYCKSLSNWYCTLQGNGKIDIPYIETSAKTGKNVNLAFETLTKLFLSSKEIEVDD